MTVRAAPAAAPTVLASAEGTVQNQAGLEEYLRPAAAEVPANLLSRLTEEVVRAIDHRALAHRERFGRF
jgi:hypothetical protein